MKAVVPSRRFEPQRAVLGDRPIISIEIPAEDGPPDRSVPGVGMGRPYTGVPAQNGDSLFQFERGPPVPPQDEPPPIRQIHSRGHANFTSVDRHAQRILKRGKRILPA